MELKDALSQATHTKVVKVGHGVLASIPELLREHFSDQRVMIVADQNTYTAAGERVSALLTSARISTTESHVFPAKPRIKSDYDHVQTIALALKERGSFPLAVGSGTINDICKLAAFETDRPYMVIATAASMDGYASFGASISHHGVKQTDPCNAAHTIVADLDILTAAPAWLNAAGYADLLGKITAGADWLVADALGVEPVQPQIFDMVQGNLRDWTGDPEGIQNRDPLVVKKLLEGLLITGFAMQAARSSRPASGSEHLLSHLWDMQGVKYEGERAPHGFTVGLGLLLASSLYQKLLVLDPQGIDADLIVERALSRDAMEKSIRRSFPIEAVVESAVEATLSKHLSPDAHLERIRKFVDRWPGLRARLYAQLIPTEELKSMLSAAGCPTNPSAFRLSLEGLRESFLHARQIRQRYTILDLTFEIDRLEELAHELVGT